MENCSEPVPSGRQVSETPHETRTDRRPRARTRHHRAASAAHGPARRHPGDASPPALVVPLVRRSGRPGMQRVDRGQWGAPRPRPSHPGRPASRPVRGRDPHVAFDGRSERRILERADVADVAARVGRAGRTVDSHDSRPAPPDTGWNAVADPLAGTRPGCRPHPGRLERRGRDPRPRAGERPRTTASCDLTAHRARWPHGRGEGRSGPRRQRCTRGVCGADRRARVATFVVACPVGTGSRRSGPRP